MAEQLGFVVRAGTAGPTGVWWVSALPCRRRPGRRLCLGHLSVLRGDDEAPIEWSCPACGDEGTISGWQNSPFDLRQAWARPGLSGQTVGVSVSEGTAATLRSMMLLDPDSERLVFQTQAGEDGLVMAATEEDLEELIGFVAAEANHETNKRRQRRLDAAFIELSDALTRAGS